MAPPAHQGFIESTYEERAIQEGVSIKAIAETYRAIQIQLRRLNRTFRRIQKGNYRNVHSLKDEVKTSLLALRNDLIDIEVRLQTTLV